MLVFRKILRRYLMDDPKSIYSFWVLKLVPYISATRGYQLQIILSYFYQNYEDFDQNHLLF